MVRVPVRRVGFVIVIVLIGFSLVGLGALLGPVRVGAWPWDDSRDIHVHGQVVCRNIDVGQPYGIPKVEYLAIRGRSNTLTKQMDSYVNSWSTAVPPGWRIEWFLKCSGESKPDSGSFIVDKTAVGSSYDQTRDICNASAIPFEPCTDQRFGGCVAMLFDGTFEPPDGSFEDALRIFQNVYAGGWGPNSATECLAALRGLGNQQPMPSTVPTLPTLPVPGPTLPTLQTLPTVPPRAPTTTPPAGTPPPTHRTTTTRQPPTRVNAYDNYGSGAVGRAMCRGNPDSSVSMPGGVATETFPVPQGVASIDSVKVQIDPDSSVTAHASLSVNGSLRASTSATANGDTFFGFGSVGVAPGDEVTLTISFTASYGKIITVYTVGDPGGRFVAANSCPDGAPNVDTSSSGLRAVFSGWSR